MNGPDPSSDVPCPDPDKSLSNSLAFINANVDQRIATIRDVLFKANDNGLGVQLNAKIEATIDMMADHENPVNRICAELMEIGHCIVIDSMAKASGIGQEPPANG